MTELRGYNTATKAPERAITYHGIEDGQQLAGDREDGDCLGLAGCREVLEEGLEHGVMSPGHEGACTLTVPLPMKLCGSEKRMKSARKAHPFEYTYKLRTDKPDQFWLNPF